MSHQTEIHPPASPVKTLGIFALLKPKPGATREQIMALMPAEARATAQLYLRGMIREWYTRADGKGAVFLLNTPDPEEANSILESLPLAQAHVLEHELIPVGPLMPLGLLLGANGSGGPTHE